MKLALSVAAVVLCLAWWAIDAQATSRITVGAAAISRIDRHLGKPGRVSDITEQVWSIRDRHGTSIGRLFLACHWVSNAARLCTGVLRLPLGTLSLNGWSDTPFAGSLAVTGGTRRYFATRGEAMFTSTGEGRMILTITLIT